jgi:hypothetical protein
VAPLCWAVAAGWAAVLVVRELAGRHLRYGPDRWATVFPLGMLSAIAAAAGPHAMTVAAAPLALVAVTAWLATTAGAVVSARPRALA